MKRPAAGILAGLMLAGLVMPLAACADGVAPRATGEHARTPTRLETAPRKVNGSGITVRYQVPAAIAPGQTARVTLVLDDVVDPDGASVRLAADGGLVLLQDGRPLALPAGRATTLEVDVTLQDAAVGYLSVFTTQRGVTSVTSIRVPVAGGTAATGSPTRLKETPEGEKLIVIPVK